MKVRTAFLVLLLLTLLSAAYYLLIYIPRHSKAGEPVLAFRNYFLAYTPLQPIGEAAYVLPESLEVWDTPAVIRTQIATLMAGDQVYALARFHLWAHVRLLDGRDGWVDKDGLMTAATYAEDEHLLSELSTLPAQARGHAADLVNIHIEPSRNAAVVAQRKAGQELVVFERRMVERPQESDTAEVPSTTSNPVEAWYLVRSGSRAGWILGHLVELDVPKSISGYAEDVNLVAWLVLNTVDDFPTGGASRGVVAMSEVGFWAKPAMPWQSADSARHQAEARVTRSRFQLLASDCVSLDKRKTIG